jgi:hypothetical protein
MKTIWQRRSRTYPMKGWSARSVTATDIAADRSPSAQETLRGHRRKPGTLPNRTAPYQRPT